MRKLLLDNSEKRRGSRPGGLPDSPYPPIAASTPKPTMAASVDTDSAEET